MEVRMKCRGVCAFLAEKSRATNYIICVFERQPGRSHVWPGGCRRRDPSSCLRAVKWSRWRAAEEDIIQRLIILSGSRRALCFAGCRRWRGGGPRPNIRCHSQRQWMDNGHPSIFHASLSHGLEPTTMSISKQFDPFSWLIHQPDLICNPDRFPKESRVGFRGEDERKNIESEGEPMTGGPKYCSERSRWAMVFISVPRWLIYFIDGLFISQPWTDMYLSSWREVWRGFIQRRCSTSMYIPFSQLTSSGHQDLSKSESRFKWSGAPRDPASAEQLLPAVDYYFSRGWLWCFNNPYILIQTDNKQFD